MTCVYFLPGAGYCSLVCTLPSDNTLRATGVYIVYHLLEEGGWGSGRMMGCGRVIVRQGREGNDFF